MRLVRAWDLSTGRPVPIERKKRGHEIIVAQLADPFAVAAVQAPRAPVLSGSWSINLYELDPRYKLVVTPFFRRASWYERRRSAGQIPTSEILADHDGKNYTVATSHTDMIRKDESGAVHVIGKLPDASWINNGSIPDGTELTTATAGARITLDYAIQSVSVEPGTSDQSRPMMWGDLTAGAVEVTIHFSDNSTTTATVRSSHIVTDQNDITALFSPAWSGLTGKQITSVTYRVTQAFAAVAGGDIDTLQIRLQVSVGGEFATINCLAVVGETQTVTLPVEGTLIPNYANPIFAICTVDPAYPVNTDLIGTVTSAVTDGSLALFDADGNPVTWDKMPTYDLVCAVELVPNIRLGCDGMAEEVTDAIDIDIDKGGLLSVGNTFTYSS